MSLSTDFEVFLTHSKTGLPVPATIFGLNGKTGAHRPLYLDGEEVGTVHRDNMMLEMCTPPQETAGGLATAVSRVLYAAQEFV